MGTTCFHNYEAVISSARKYLLNRCQNLAVLNLLWSVSNIQAKRRLPSETNNSIATLISKNLFFSESIFLVKFCPLVLCRSTYLVNKGYQVVVMFLSYKEFTQI